MPQKRTETITPSGVKVVETRYDGGFTEISVYKPTVATSEPRLQVHKLTAVVSRQIVGGKWVVHTDKTSRAFLTRLKGSAVDWAVTYAEDWNEKGVPGGA